MAPSVAAPEPERASLEAAAEGASPAAPVKRTRAETLRRFGFGFGQSATGLVDIPISMLLLFFLTEIVGLKASLASLVLALPKIWDALVDPMLGGWTDLAAMRLGTRTPILLVSSAIYIAMLILLFSMPAFETPWHTAAVATGLLIVSSMAQTVFGVSQLSLATAITRDSTDLTGLLSLAAIIGVAFSIGGSVLTPLLVQWSGGGAVGYSRMAMEIGLFAGMLMLVFAFATRSAPVKGSREEAAATPLIASIRATLHNHSFYALMGYLTCFGTGSAILSAFLPYANRYVLHGGANSLAAFGGIAAVATIAGLPLAPVLARRLGEMRALNIGNLVVASSFLLLFAAGFGPMWVSWVAVAGVGVASGALGVLARTTLLEVAQRPLKTGAVVPLGFYLGILIAGAKLGMSAGGFAAGQLLSLIGFVSGGAAQSAGTIVGLRLGYSAIPFVFFALGGLFLRMVGPAPKVNAVETAQGAA